MAPAALMGLALAVAGYFLWDIIAATGKVPSFVTDKFSKTKETRVVAPIAGTLVASDIATRKPIAVVIENHPDARPQSGLNKADLVYETFAEGGITRFLAIFQTQEHKEIGPVRSARAAGYSYEGFISRIVEVALARSRRPSSGRS